MKVKKMKVFKKIMKRDGTIVDFDKNKISNAIWKAAKGIGGKDKKRADELAEIVVDILIKENNKKIPSVERIQDIVERVLIEQDHAKTAKAFILYRQKRSELRKAKSLLGVEDDLKLSLNAITVLNKRYLRKDENGKVIETPKQMFERVAKAIALAEKRFKTPSAEQKELENEFFRIMNKFEFLPNSPTLMNAGTGTDLSLSACFVLPVEDSIESIFEAIKNMAIIQQSGGGTGFTFNHLRPSEDIVKKASGVASGPISFMKAFNSSTEIIKQGGCISANSLVRTDMGVLPVGNLLNCPPLGQNFTKRLVYDGKMFNNAFISMDNGFAEVFKFKTDIGLSIESTYNHQIGCVDENGEIIWKDSQQIKEGDWLVVVLGGHNGNNIELPKIEKQHFNANPIKIPEKMTSEIGEILGLYMADGCFSTGGRMIFSVDNKDQELIDRIEYLMNNAFGLKVGIKEDSGTYTDMIFYSRDLKRFFEKMNWKKKSSFKAFVPDEIFVCSRKVAEAFVSGLFEGDGDVHSDGYPRLYSTSKKLIDQTQQLLLGLNIVSRYRKYEKGENSYGKKPMFQLMIIQDRSIRLFKNEIGFVTKRKNETLKARYHVKDIEYNDIIPNQSEKIKSFYNYVGRGSGKNRSKRGTDTKLYRSIYHYISDAPSSKRNLTRKRLYKLMSEFSIFKENEHFKKISDSKYYFTKVKKIERTKNYTMDIEVPGSGKFVANGILVHNKRRGANMGILRVDHPDILDFIVSKETEGSLNNFNISVALNDKFMNAVEKNKDFDLINPRTGKKDKTVKARAIWNLIITMAWKNGEPGIVFIDTINKANPTPEYGTIESTNPCVTGDTLISSELGLVRMKDLVEKHSDGEIEIAVDNRVPIQIKNRNGTISLMQYSQQGTSFNKITRAFCTGIKETYKLVTKSGYELTCTGDHKVMTNEGWIKVTELDPEKHTVFIQSGQGKFNSNYQLPFKTINTFVGKNGRVYNLNLPSVWSKKLGQVLGLLVGDGWIRDGDKNCRVGFTFSEKDKEILEYIKPIINNWYGSDIDEILRENNVFHLSYHSKWFVDFFKNLGIKVVNSNEKVVPESIFTTPKEAVIGFLQGLFTADGTIGINEKNNVNYIRLTSKSTRLLKGVQLLLLNLGIKSKIYNRSRPPKISFHYTNKNGEVSYYKTDGKCYELHIGRECVRRFIDMIGFLLNKNKSKIEKLNSKSFYKTVFEDKIISLVKSNDKEKVYDLTEPKTLSFISNGLVSLDCGEQPLLPYESCNLGSINLGKMIEDGKIDWDKLGHTVRLATRFLDNVIEINKFPLKELDKMNKKTRKIGLGVMGFADMLIELGIPYNSEQGVKIAEKIMKFITDESRKMSEELGKRRGSFEEFKGSVWDKKYKHMRNATTTTIAPTGTIGVIAGCSQGCEPLFAISYIRNVQDTIGSNLAYINPFFESKAIMAGIYDEELMKKIAMKSTIQNIKEIPESIRKVFVTAHDISPEWHVKMQAAFQKNTDNAVSKTINFSNHATPQDIEKAYWLAYKLKCKGITVYRDGSRKYQILTTSTVE